MGAADHRGVENEIIRIMGGLAIEVVVPSHASGHTCCVFIEHTPPGAGPPPHKHLREEEIFTVLDGRYEFYDGETWTPMTVGLSVLSRRGTYHAFRNIGAVVGRMMAMTNGGGIDDYFRAISALELPKDLDRLTEISAHYGYYYQPPTPAG